MFCSFSSSTTKTQHPRKEMVYVDKLRQNALQVVGDARNQHLSPYEEWTSDELRDLLVQYKIPIRDSANASHETLVRICDKVFGVAVAESVKESRRHYSIEDLARMEAAARVIQKAFLRRQAFKRKESHQYHDYHEDEYCLEGTDCDQETFEDHSIGVEAGRYIRLRKLSMLKRICEQDMVTTMKLTLCGKNPVSNLRRSLHVRTDHMDRVNTWLGMTGLVLLLVGTVGQVGVASNSIFGMKEGRANSRNTAAALQIISRCVPYGGGLRRDVIISS